MVTTFINKLCLMAVTLALCLSLSAPAAMSDALFDEHTRYDQAMELISSWKVRNDRQEQAIKIALQMLQNNPDSARAYTVLGRAAWWKGYINGQVQDHNKVREAQTYYRKAIATDHDFLEAEYYLAVSHAALEEYGQALRLADKLEKEHPNWYQAYFIRIKVAEKKKDHETLLQLCLDQQNRFPRNEESLRITESNLLIAYTGLSMLDKAEAIHIKRMEKHPDNARVLGDYAAFLCDHKKDYDKAAMYAQTALSVMDYGMARQTLAISAFNKAKELFEQRRFEEAEPYLLLTLGKKPNYMRAWVGLTTINYTLAQKYNDPVRLQKAYITAQNAERFGMKGQQWTFIQMKIAADMKRIQKQVAMSQN
jgi:tetratricopeptide (TPR) repeat protein